MHRPCVCLPPLCSPLSVVFYALLGPVLLSVPPHVVNFVRAGTFSRSPLYPPCLASWRRKVNPGNESVSSSREGFPRASLDRWRSRPWGHEDAHGLPPGFGGLLCPCSGWGLSPSGHCPQSSLASFQFAWNLAFGLEAPSPLLTLPPAPHLVLGGFSRLLPSWVASTVWAWGSSFTR